MRATFVEDELCDNPLRLKMPAFGRRDSLVRQASIDRVHNEDTRRRSTFRCRKQLESQSSLGRALIQRLNDAGVQLLMRKFHVGAAPLLMAAKSMDTAGGVESAMELAAEDGILQLSLVFNYTRESRAALATTIQALISSELSLKHVETRADKVHENELELLANCRGTRAAFLDALTKLTASKNDASLIERIQLCEPDATEYPALDENDASDNEEVEDEALDVSSSKCLWYPKHVSELDLCAHVVVKYEPTQDPKHPGYGDAVYIARRGQLNEIANSYRYGDVIPNVKYTPLENQTWQLAYSELKKLRATHTCAQYQKNVEKMEADGVITPHVIPELGALSKYIQKQSGFELRPCGGLLSARDFLASLAFRVFQSTLYVRHHSRPNHCPEPDVIHEVLGHCPMFADPHLAQLSQEIGLLSLGASDEQIERLSTVYWFIIEFGLCKENNRLKAIGAGLISAFGELQYACSDKPAHEPFVPEVTALREYEDSDYQPVYFVAESIQDALERLRNYAHKLCPKFASIYAPLTRTVERLPVSELFKRKMEEVKEGQRQIEKLTQQILATENIS